MKLVFLNENRLNKILAFKPVNEDNILSTKINILLLTCAAKVNFKFISFQNNVNQALKCYKKHKLKKNTTSVKITFFTNLFIL